MNKIISLQVAVLFLTASAFASSEYNEVAPKLTFEKCKRKGSAEVGLPEGDCARLTDAETGGKFEFETVEVEKCFGIVKAGQNDGIDGHSDGAKKATEDNNPKAWIDLPLHTCETLGGSVRPSQSEGTPADVTQKDV